MTRKPDHTYKPAVGDRVLVWATVAKVHDRIVQNKMPVYPCTVKVDMPKGLHMDSSPPLGEVYVHAADLQAVAYEQFGVGQYVFLHDGHRSERFGFVRGIVEGASPPDDNLWIETRDGDFCTRLRKACQRSEPMAPADEEGSLG